MTVRDEKCQACGETYDRNRDSARCPHGRVSAREAKELVQAVMDAGWPFVDALCAVVAVTKGEGRG